MKALSIQQPWAWFICKGYKPVENRTWKTNYRGPLLVHAGKRFDSEGLSWVLHEKDRLIGPDRMPNKSEFYCGGIIGRVNLVDIVDDHPSIWFFGPWGFVFENPELFDKPIPCPGRLGLFDIVKEYNL